MRYQAVDDCFGNRGDTAPSYGHPMCHPRYSSMGTESCFWPIKQSAVINHKTPELSRATF